MICRVHISFTWKNPNHWFLPEYVDLPFGSGALTNQHIPVPVNCCQSGRLSNGSKKAAHRIRMERDIFISETCTGWWFGTFFVFPYIGNVIIPTDFHMFQTGRYTTNQIGEVHTFSHLFTYKPYNLCLRG